MSATSCAASARLTARCWLSSRPWFTGCQGGGAATKPGARRPNSTSTSGAAGPRCPSLPRLCAHVGAGKGRGGAGSAWRPAAAKHLPATRTAARSCPLPAPDPFWPFPPTPAPCRHTHRERGAQAAAGRPPSTALTGSAARRHWWVASQPSDAPGCGARDAHRERGAQAAVGHLVGQLLQAQRHVQAFVRYLVHWGSGGWREGGRQRRPQMREERRLIMWERGGTGVGSFTERACAPAACAHPWQPPPAPVAARCSPVPRKWYLPR